MSSSAPNVISGRIAEALGRFPPFSLLHDSDIRRLAEAAEVRVLVAGDQVWVQGDPPGEQVLFLARGRVEYVWRVDERDELVDVRDVGDILGLSALVEGAAFSVTANVVEDTLLYCLPWKPVSALLASHDEARNYARRHLFWATRVGRTMPALGSGQSSVLQAHLQGARAIEPRPPERLLTCLPDSPIAEAASLMVSKRVPSVLVVDERQFPVGIVTSNNLVKQVIVGTTDPKEPVRKVMASPVVTVAPRSSATAAILIMLRERIGQVCVTEDGTPQSRALDVCTQKDLLAQSGHHPAGLIREIRLARSAARFREICDEIEDIARTYLESGISGVFMGQICAELYDELVKRLLEEARSSLSAEGVTFPKVPWAWMSVGSDGRREQVLRTDMDNALVFASQGYPEADEAAREVFLRLSERVIAALVDCGFSRCQGGVMASNPRWCRTDAEWIEELEKVGHQLDSGDVVLRALVLYDLRYVGGDPEICETIRRKVFETAGSSEALQRRLAALCVETPPPLNFWGRFVVEKRGGHAGQFDIKSRGLAPLRDAGRLFALRYGLTRHYSTGGRWLQLRDAQPHLAEVAQLANDGYDLLLRLRVLTGLRRGDAGRYFAPESLTKLQRAQLANVFDVQRMVQEAVRKEFRLEPRVR